MISVPFIKMHGCGNDYIYFDCMSGEENNIIARNPNKFSIMLSDRHKSIGGDGVVLICPSAVADAKMRMFNADGSEGKMCGNAIRCVGKYLYDNKYVKKSDISIETLSGIKYLKMQIENGVAVAATVDMGKAYLKPAEIPVIYDGENMINAPVTVNGKNYNITCVSMGNPHCIVFCGENEDPETLELEKIGPYFENHAIFPDRVNTEFVKVINKNLLQMRVWERGSGETLACGTGSCAVAVAAVLCGFCEKNTDITIRLRGGDLVINYTGETVYMTGEAKVAFRGVADIED